MRLFVHIINTTTTKAKMSITTEYTVTMPAIFETGRELTEYTGGIDKVALAAAKKQAKLEKKETAAVAKAEKEAAKIEKARLAAEKKETAAAAKAQKELEKQRNAEERAEKKMMNEEQKIIKCLKQKHKRRKILMHQECSDDIYRLTGEICNNHYPNGWTMTQFNHELQTTDMLGEKENVWGTDVTNPTYDYTASRRTYFHERSPSSCQYWFKNGRFINGTHIRPCFVNKVLAESNARLGWDKVYKENTGRRGQLWMYVPNLDLNNWDEEQYGPLPNKEEQLEKQRRRDAQMGKGVRSYVNDTVPHRIQGYRSGFNKEQSVVPELLHGLL